MIKNFKLYNLNENELGINEGELMEGDYFIMNTKKCNFYSFIENKIGLALRVRKHYKEFDAGFEQPIGKIFGLQIDCVKYWCREKEVLERLIDIKKYNL